MIQYEVSDGACVLSLCAPPVNALTLAGLDELRGAIARANDDPAVRGTIITGSAEHFSAGADIGIFQDFAGPEDATRVSRLFQEAFDVVEDSAKPVVAAVAGRVMGGALELAMACHFRVAATGADFSMPEVKLGFNPAAGGTQRLPRLIGPARALQMMLTGEPIRAEEAHAAGLVDAVCEGDRLVEAARAFVSSLPRRTRDCQEKVRDAAANEAALREAERTAERARPEIIAPRMIVETVRRGLAESFQAGLRKEQEAFAQCLTTPATKNRIYLFFATRATGKSPARDVTSPPAALPAGGERGESLVHPSTEITKTAVIGIGSMGSGIAQALIVSGLPVMACDQDSAALEKGVKRIANSLDKRVSQRKLSAEQRDEILRRLTVTSDWQAIAGADLVIEAVFEDVAVKRSVIARIEGICPASTLIASNTSTISLDLLAEGMRHPARLIGMHFFNPAQRMPLVEVIRRDTTPESVLAAALKLAKTIRKTPVVVRNREGFIVNRLFVPYVQEAFGLLEEGAEPPAIDAAMVAFGFPMGPLRLIDIAGLDILLHADRVLSGAFPRHGSLSSIAVRLVESGHLGQKTGAGVYRYDRGDTTPHASETTARIIAQGQQDAACQPRRIADDEITRRLVLRIVNEALHVWQAEIAEREADIDVASVLGMGFPDFRGGVLKYARDRGLESVYRELDKLSAECGARYVPPERL